MMVGSTTGPYNISMTSDDIPDSVRHLLREHLESFEQLEVLLFLKQRANERYSVSEMATQLNLTAQAAVEATADLSRAALVQEDLATRQFAYGSPSLDPAIDVAVAELLRIYSRQNLPIIKLMAENSLERVRAGALRAFSDAFNIRKGKDRG